VKSYNSVPLLIFIFGIVSLNIVQAIRHTISSDRFFAFILYSYPNFIVSFSFPFSILLRPKVFSKTQSRSLFLIWAIVALIIEVWFEIKSPLPGPHTYDFNDIIATVIGSLLATVVYFTWLHRRLKFADQI
jgi:glycopeptide antibiotics resistance protein